MSRTIVDVDPKDLVVAENIRKDTKLTKAFVASVKQHGVLVPILAQEGLQGYEVLDGQRRTLAALEAGVASVPAVIVPPFAKDSERIVDQLVVNEHRESLTAGEQVAAVKQLELFGMPASAIAKKTGSTKSDVEKTLAIAGSALGAQLVERQLGLDHAAAILEFDGHPEIVSALTEAALESPRSFPHELERARAQKVLAEQRQKLVADLTAEGFEVRDEVPEWQDKAQITEVEDLYRDAERSQRLVAMGERPGPEMPGVKAVPVLDWVRPDGDGEWERAWTVRFFIDGWKGLGFFSRIERQAATPAGEKSEEQSEQEKAERRRVIANNKAWPAATRIRVAWITETLLKAKKLPATAQALIVLKQTSDLPKETFSSGVSEGLDWLGAEQTDRRTPRAVRFLEQHPDDAERLNLAIALASVELGIKDKSSWRYYEQAKLVRYLALLASWGYGLSELEQSLVDAK